MSLQDQLKVDVGLTWRDDFINTYHLLNLVLSLLGCLICPYSCANLRLQLLFALRAVHRCVIFCLRVRMPPQGGGWQATRLEPSSREGRHRGWPSSSRCAIRRRWRWLCRDHAQEQRSRGQEGGRRRRRSCGWRSASPCAGRRQQLQQCPKHRWRRRRWQQCECRGAALIN